jgi:hypothetical protein
MRLSGTVQASLGGQDPHLHQLQTWLVVGRTQLFISLQQVQLPMQPTARLDKRLLPLLALRHHGVFLEPLVVVQE